MQPTPARRSNQTWLWVLLGAGGLCAVCGAGAVALAGLGLVAGASDSTGPGGVSAAEQPGAPGGFALQVPASFALVSEGRWRFEKAEGTARHTVDVIRLPSVSAEAGPVAALTQQWNAVIVRDWPGAPTQVLPLRRFVNNGARAYFTSAQLTAAQNDHPSLVSLYLVEADERLEPFVVLQEFFDKSVGAAIVAQYSFDQSQPAVEEFIKGVEGSPVGRRLVDEAEVVGAWRHGSGASMQYVHVLTGSTTFSAVSYTIGYTFGADHSFRYEYSGANTQLGSTTFGGDRDTGTWKLEHDLLVLDGERFDRKFFIVGAGPGPAGRRVLYLVPEGHWSLSPGAIAQHGQLYEEAE